MSLNLLQLTNLQGRIGNGVSIVPGPGGSQAFKLSRPFTLIAQDSSWIALNQRIGNCAFFCQIDSNYSGNLLQWSSYSGNILKVDIEKDAQNNKILSVQLFDQLPIKFQLPASVEDYLSISFSIKYGCTITVYADCYQIISADLPNLLYGANTTRNVTIFQTASPSSMPMVFL